MEIDPECREPEWEQRLKRFFSRMFISGLPGSADYCTRVPGHEGPCNGLPMDACPVYVPPTVHRCFGSAAALVIIRFVDYGERTLWQLDVGRTSLFNIHHCPYCGKKLGRDAAR